jgi:hypothetical protein
MGGMPRTGSCKIVWRGLVRLIWEREGCILLILIKREFSLYIYIRFHLTISQGIHVRDAYGSCMRRLGQCRSLGATHKGD